MRGFTSLEVLAAIFVFSVGALGVFALVQVILTSTSLSFSRLTAAYLAQEGIEIVRNIRDSNWLRQREEPEHSWDSGLTCPSPPCQFEADYDDSSLYPYYGIPLKINNFYNYVSGEDTPFKRRITTLKTPEEPDLLKVWVTVSWRERGKEHSITVQENLSNWR